MNLNNNYIFFTYKQCGKHYFNFRINNFFLIVFFCDRQLLFQLLKQVLAQVPKIYGSAFTS
jgi:hypothetical protein